MAILINHSNRVVIQGITGREGIARTRLMKDYGSTVVAGVTPGKGGETVEGIPVFDTVREACERVGPLDTSVLFVPAPLVRNAALEALDAGIKLLVIVPDRVPIYDVLEIAETADRLGARFIGPNTLGVLSPDQGVLGMMGGRAESARQWFFPGPVGITSRSGGITTSMAYYLARAGVGASTLVHVGGDAVVGMPHSQILRLFQQDPETKLVVLFGEIGTSQEEEVADLIAAGEFNKPVIAYIGGKAAKSGTRFSHAGAIIESGRGTYEGKVIRLRDVGVHVVDSFAQIPEVARRMLETKPRREKSAESDNLNWKTAVTQIEPNEIRLRGYRLDELMGKVSFAQTIYLALMGELPSPQIGKLLDALFVSSIDHGATPPSALAARTVASTGAPLNAAVATGILSINRHHGGAIEDSMRMIQSALARMDTDHSDNQAAAAALIADYKANNQRLPGFGHRIHTDDPRTKRLLEMVEETGVAGKGVAMLKALESTLAAQGRRLPANVDGAIAALLVDLNIPPELANAFFMIARVPGLVAQVAEEMTRERPMRRIHPTDQTYDGPSPRSLPDDDPAD